ncbi:alginate export family protein [Caulobacter segnis]|uniref:alginate export family protein n=1 Tax=Caulobacter segnis TaxID=88688 RepID=UPI00285DCA9E|nr:alginate export family protein [Caulobacter segnis]MDR6624425.1 hypothetical protein [Caulobacter segnis]
MIAALLAFGALQAAAQPPAFKLIRADEDYGYLRDKDRTGLDPLRYIPVGTDGYLSLGGEARLRFDTMDAPRFGVGGAQADSFALARGLVSADLHLNPVVRVYGELGLHRDLGKREAPAVTDRDGLDAQVLFTDIVPSRAWRLRLGRQELSFNATQRFVSVREGPNVRQSFDGARLTYAAKGAKLEAFYAHPIAIEPGALNDSHNAGQAFWGVYATLPGGLDVYSLNLDRDRVRFGAVTGDERRRSLGARFAGNTGAIDYEVEAMAQRGRFAGQDIRAWGGGAGAGYTFAAPWKPRLSVRRDLGSGDHDPTDGKLATFNPLFPKGAYFSEAGLVSWSNLSAWRIGLDATPTRAVTAALSHTDRRRQARPDAIYLQPYAVLVGAGSAMAKGVSRDWQVDVAWQVNRNVKLSVEAVHSAVGAAVEAAGGHDVDFAMAIVQLRF